MWSKFTETLPFQISLHMYQLLLHQSIVSCPFVRNYEPDIWPTDQQPKLAITSLTSNDFSFMWDRIIAKVQNLLIFYYYIIYWLIYDTIINVDYRFGVIVHFWHGDSHGNHEYTMWTISFLNYVREKLQEYKNTALEMSLTLSHFLRHV